MPDSTTRGSAATTEHAPGCASERIAWCDCRGMPTPWPVQADATPDPVELVLRHHLPVPFGEGGPILCICSAYRTYEGPVYHRLHVVDELRKARLLRD